MPGPYGPPRKMPFGRHKGELLAEMHEKDLTSTLDWLATKPDSFADLRAEIQKILAGRRGGDNPANNPSESAGRMNAVSQRGATSAGGTGGVSRDIYDMALLLIKVGANVLDGLEHTGAAADWLRSLAGAAPPQEPF